MSAKQPGAARTHTIRRVGNFAKFAALNADTQAENPLSKKVNGLRFLYMEMPAKEFVAVGVDFESSRSNDDRLVLRAPVLLIFPRHTDTVGVAADPLFGDEFAMHLLVDMIIANPEQRDALGRLLVGLGEAP